MDSPKNTALKAYNQNIAEKPLIDKMEKEFSDLNQQMEIIVQAVKAGTLSIEEDQKACEIIEEDMARMQAEQDALKKRVKENDERIKENDERIKENNERLLVIGKTIDALMETNELTLGAEDEIKELFDNTKLFYDRLAETEGKNHSEHLALVKTITSLLERQQEDLGKSFMYLYMLFGLTIVAVGADIVIRLVRG